jgi:bifunctional non-homologous end joining protein LigD
MPAVRFATVEPFTPLPLARVREPFDDPAFVFENKWDGFRALAFLTSNGATLISRNGNPFRRFAPLATALRSVLRVRDAVIDGEVVCLDGDGRPQFRELLFSRGAPSFVAFDLLALSGRDLRRLPLLERKRLLRRVTPKRRDTVLYSDHVTGRGRDVFAVIASNDLEGIVAKLAAAPYALIAGRSPFIKIKNAHYSQARDRHELFDHR